MCEIAVGKNELELHCVKPENQIQDMCEIAVGQNVKATLYITPENRKHFVNWQFVKMGKTAQFDEMGQYCHAV